MILEGTQDPDERAELGLDDCVTNERAAGISRKRLITTRRVFLEVVGVVSFKIES